MAKMYDYWHLHYEPLDPRDDQAYWKLLKQYWAVCDWNVTDLMVVEHDIVIHPDVPKVFDHCPNPVCVFDYWIGGGYAYGLGCVRFRSSVIRDRPGAIETAGLRGRDDGLGVGHWKRLDGYIWQTVGDPCRHTPPVRHLHDYPKRPDVDMALPPK